MMQKRPKRRQPTRTSSRRQKGGSSSRTVARHNRILGLVVAGLVVLLGWWYFSKFAGDDRQEKLSGPPAPPVAEAPSLKILRPLDGSVFPPDIAAPQLQWQDSTAGVGRWTIRIEFDGARPSMQFDSNAREWSPPDDAWEEIKQHSSETPAAVKLCGMSRQSPERVLSSDEVSIRTSRDEVGAPIFYREVNLPFAEAVKDPAAHIRWRFGAVSSKEKPPIVLEKLLVCGNCHSFSADGKVLGMDVDYGNDKGSYAVCDVREEISLSEDKIISWSDYRREDGKKTFGLLSQVSPDGRYVVSTVKDLSVFEAVDNLTFSQLFFPIRGVLCTYDREEAAYRSLPGADDERYVQSNPTWSPDGKFIVFARCEAYQGQASRTNELGFTRAEEISKFLAERGAFRYDLYRVPFNEGRGGRAEPLLGASDNGRSNYFARYSPDGRWIVFCQANSFMLLQPDSELYIIPAAGGQARRLACNTTRMNSWHSWSPNSRWLVFSSKAYTPYTQLFLSHIDSEGCASPPIVLSRFTARDMAANIPEFVGTASEAIKIIRTEFIEDLHHVRVADNYALAGRFDAAIEEIKKAVEIKPDRARTYRLWGVVLMSQGRLAEAERKIRRSIELKPDDCQAHWNLAKIAMLEGRHEEAREIYLKAIEIDPFYMPARLDFAGLLLEMGQVDEAVNQLTEAAEIEPNAPAVLIAFSRALATAGRLHEAVSAARKALEVGQRTGRADLVASVIALLEQYEQQMIPRPGR
jgi:tetratricopeptide (TPR) repeat protein